MTFTPSSGIIIYNTLSVSLNKLAILQTGVGTSTSSGKITFAAKQWVEIGTLSNTPISQYRCNTPITGNLIGTTNEIEISAIIAVFPDKTVRVFNNTSNSTIESSQCYFVILYKIY